MVVLGGVAQTLGQAILPFSVAMVSYKVKVFDIALLHFEALTCEIFCGALLLPIIRQQLPLRAISKLQCNQRFPDLIEIHPKFCS